MASDITIPIEEHLTREPVDLGTFVSNLVGVALSIAAIAAFIYLVWGGISWITAGGDKGKIEEARNRITGAIVGLAIVALSWAIFLLLNSFLGLGVASGSASSYTQSGSSTTAGIGFVCISQDRCDQYCPNLDYAIVRNRAITCGDNTIGCACVHEDNPKLDQAEQSGLTVQK